MQRSPIALIARKRQQRETSYKYRQRNEDEDSDNPDPESDGGETAQTFCDESRNASSSASTPLPPRDESDYDSENGLSAQETSPTGGHSYGHEFDETKWPATTSRSSDTHHHSPTQSPRSHPELPDGRSFLSVGHLTMKEAATLYENLKWIAKAAAVKSIMKWVSCQ